MDVSIDFGDILSGIAAILTAWAALRERRKKKDSAPRGEDSEPNLPKRPIGRHPSDSDFMRLSELLDSSNENDGNDFRGKPRNRGFDNGNPPPR